MFSVIGSGAGQGSGSCWAYLDFTLESRTDASMTSQAGVQRPLKARFGSSMERVKIALSTRDGRCGCRIDSSHSTSCRRVRGTPGALEAGRYYIGLG